MVTLKVAPEFELDLKDDFVMNRSQGLYKFINGDIVTAFYLGFNIKEWFKDLDAEQQYLYSKEIRHNKDDLEKYLPQISFWSKKLEGQTDEDISGLDLVEYVLNNIILDAEDEELELVKLAFHMGQVLYSQSKKDDD